MSTAAFGPAFWDERYGTAPDYVFGTAPNTFLQASAPHIAAGGPVLCLGEGEGRNAVHLAGLGHPVTAVDQSATGLAKARQLAIARGVTAHLTTQVADLADLAIAPGAWAAVVSIFCHLPLALRRVVHARAAAGLAPGGLIILEAYHPDQVHHQTGGPVGQPALLMRAEDVRTEFPGVVWEIAHAIEREVREGDGHTGRAAVVQFRGRRVG